MVAEVVRLAAVRFTHRLTAAAHIEYFQFRQHCRAPRMLQLMTALAEPRLPLLAAFAEEGLGQFHQMLLGVPEIQDDRGQRKIPAEKIFEANSAIGQRDLLLSLVPAGLRGLPTQFRTQFIQPIKAS